MIASRSRLRHAFDDAAGAGHDRARTRRRTRSKPARPNTAPLIDFSRWRRPPLPRRSTQGYSSRSLCRTEQILYICCPRRTRITLSGWMSTDAWPVPSARCRSALRRNRARVGVATDRTGLLAAAQPCRGPSLLPRLRHQPRATERDLDALLDHIERLAVMGLERHDGPPPTAQVPRSDPHGRPIERKRCPHSER